METCDVRLSDEIRLKIWNDAREKEQTALESGRSYRTGARGVRTIILPVVMWGAMYSMRYDRELDVIVSIELFIPYTEEHDVEVLIDMKTGEATYTLRTSSLALQKQL